jgi:hypothetical protein
MIGPHSKHHLTNAHFVAGMPSSLTALYVIHFRYVVCICIMNIRRPVGAISDLRYHVAPK